MDIRNALNGYFEKTPVPEELDPHNVSHFVVPNIAEKKEMRVEVQAEEETEKPTRQPRVQPAEESRVGTQSVKSAESEYVPAEKIEEAQEEPINASAFIKIVRYNRLTGKEFLSILGNSKISNKAYQEIESNPRLTVKRLIELLEESPLTSADYEKLIIAVQRMAELKAEAKAKIKSEPPRVNPRADLSAETTSHMEPIAAAVETNIKISPKKEENVKPGSIPEKKPSGYVPSAAKYYYDPDDPDDDDKENSGDSDDNESGSEEEKNSEERLTSLKSRIQINFDDDENDEDDDDDEEDDDDGEYGRKHGSNGGKIAVSAIGAVLLIALSFGLRYSLTGSWLPAENTEIIEEVLDEGKIFDMLSSLPAPSPAFTGNTLYSAGGLKEDSLFKDPICGNKRLLYTEDNKLHIYEQIGGQIAKLETREYKERTLIGIIDAGDKLAAISTGTAPPYSYSYTVPSEDGDGTDSLVTGTVQRNETYVEITDAASPEKVDDKNRITLSGTFVTAYLQDNRLIFVTYEELPKDSAAGDKATFMPYLAVGGDKTFCAAEKVFVSAPTHKGIAAVFSVDINEPGTHDLAAAAGGSKALVGKGENELFIGQGSTLIRYSLSNGISENGHCEIAGSISDFSGISSADGEIRITTLEKNAETEEYSATLTVLDNELTTVGEVKSIGKGETLLSTCFYKNETYIVTENGVCFGIDGENSVMSQSSVKITNETVYKYSDNIGIKISAADDGAKRTGLIVSTVRLDGNLTPLYNLEISSKTVAADALDEYLSSPAEENIFSLGGSMENGFLVIPVEYFDGVSQVDSDVVIAFTKGKIITADARDGTVLAYFLM